MTVTIDMLPRMPQGMCLHHQSCSSAMSKDGPSRLPRPWRKSWALPEQLTGT